MEKNISLQNRDYADKVDFLRREVKKDTPMDIAIGLGALFAMWYVILVMAFPA